MRMFLRILDIAPTHPLRRARFPERRASCTPGSGVMARPFTSRQPTTLPAGAVVWLLALGLVAPPAAQAGCSHLVTSRTDPAVRIASLIESSVGDLAGRSA